MAPLAIVEVGAVHFGRRRALQASEKIFKVRLSLFPILFSLALYNHFRPHTYASRLHNTTKQLQTTFKIPSYTHSQLELESLVTSHNPSI
jgi:hypothetical protein